MYIIRPPGGVVKEGDDDVAEMATSRIQKSEVRSQNFNVSPSVTDLNVGDNAGRMDAPGDEDVAETATS